MGEEATSDASQASSDAAQAPPEAVPSDEIAAGLPGLPLNTKRLRVARDGFRRREKLVVPWERVTSVTASGGRVAVEGTREGARGGVKRLLHVGVGASAARAVESVWTELCFRRIQRDGKLSGGVNSWGLRRAVAVRFLAAAMLVLLAARRGYVVFTPNGVRGRSEVPVDGEVQEKRDEAEKEAGSDAAGGGLVSAEWGGVALLAYFGAGAAALGVLARRRSDRLKTWWSRWELRREGLFLWDEDGGAKRLALSGRTRVTPAGLRGSDESVFFHELTARPVLARLSAAMAERAGVAPKAVSLHVFAKRLLGAFVLFVPGPALIAALVWGLRAGAASLVALTLIVLAGGVYRYVSGHIRAKKALARFLEDGRSMLKRLGW